MTHECSCESCGHRTAAGLTGWTLTFDVGDREVVFGFLLAGVRLGGSRGPTGDLVLPEEGHHEGLLGARAPPTHQADPGCRQGAV